MGLTDKFEARHAGMEEELTSLQRRSASELRVEVRTAIRNEAAAVAALDEQLWLTDQRLGERIDELMHVHASYARAIGTDAQSAKLGLKGSSIGSSHAVHASPRRTPIVSRPITPARNTPTRLQRPATASVSFAAEIGESALDSSQHGTSEHDISGSSDGALGMAS